MARKISLIVICLIFAASIILAATTFTKSTNSYYGRQSVISKYVIAVTPRVNDANTVRSTSTSTDEIHGDLRRISIKASDTDTSFKIYLKDSDGITLFSKTDCSTATLPLSYALDIGNTAATKFNSILCAGTLTFDTNDVDPNNLTSITATIYYVEQRY